MKRYIFLWVGLLLFLSCNDKTESTKANLNKEINFRNDLPVQIIDTTGKLIAEFNTELADDEYERQTGLMYRKHMKDNQAMLFVFEEEAPKYFYMKNTYIPLDIIYVDKSKKIVSWSENAKPLDETSLPSGKPAQYVLEIKGGLIKQKGIKKGMHLKFTIPASD